ncbi:Hyaluronidase PH-20 [Liparis tanakae]|uniref:Hyaluronidase n=1 Tax=Liparis tanakae TaxID=230148 RepID=A0A4Z2ELW2_9TELE|nr:Hyaluronidase PH-20 [Liparis tanakae]
MRWLLFDYAPQFDLVNTIGEAAALGAAGIISWGDMDVTDSEASCSDAQSHLLEVMNPYILNLTTAARLCSEALCQGRGRCVRKHWDDNVYLHLDPRRYRIDRRRPGAPLTVSGSLSQRDVDYFDRRFDCICYDEKTCRSVLMLKAVSEAVVNTAARAAHRPRPLLLATILLSLMRI